MMRGINTTVRRLRRKVFEEVAALGFKADADTLCDDMEAIPYALVNDETEQYRDSVYRARAVVREQVRLAMGLALRPEDKPVHLTAGVEASNISDKYYEPPLMQVIPSACMRCEAKGYEVSNMCKGCLAHPCMEVCPKGAISMVNGKSYIDQEKCIKCGKCKSVCPYDAISKKERPCAKACGVNAIENDKVGRAYVNPDKCVSCGMCMVNCPFGAISDKSQIFQLPNHHQKFIGTVSDQLRHQPDLSIIFRCQIPLYFFAHFFCCRDKRCKIFIYIWKIMCISIAHNISRNSLHRSKIK